MNISNEDQERLARLRDDAEGGPMAFLAGMVLQITRHIEAKEEYDAEMNRAGDY